VLKIVAPCAKAAKNGGEKDVCYVTGTRKLLL